MIARAATPEEVSALRVTEVELFSVAGHDGYVREVNVAFARLLGLEPAAVNGHSLLEFVHPDDLAAVVAALSALQKGAAEVQVENRFTHGDGGWFHLQWVARPVPGTDLWSASGRDTTAFHRLLAERSNLQTRLDLVIGQATAAMWDWDIDRGLLTWEAQAAEVLGVTVDTVPASIAELTKIVDPADQGSLSAAFDQLLDVGTVEVTVRMTVDGSPHYLSLRGKLLDRDRRGRAVRAVGLVLDITTEKAMEEQMLRMIMSDPLTGIPNRRAFDQTLRSQWRKCIRENEPIAVMMIDIDDFKKCNDTFGHLVGDVVLCAVARGLNNAIRQGNDTLARFGGEEFSVVMPDTDRDAALVSANRLVAAVRAITVHQAAGWPLTVSIGTFGWQPGEERIKAAEALDHADQALYVAKGAGKNQAVGHHLDRMASVDPLVSESEPPASDIAVHA